MFLADIPPSAIAKGPINIAKPSKTKNTDGDESFGAGPVSDNVNP
jgi:hypothetical protein